MRAFILAGLLSAAALPAMAQDQNDPLYKAAVMTVANERCGDVFDKDAANTVIVAISMKTGSNVYETSKKVSALADGVRAQVTPEHKDEFCAWAKSAASTMAQ